MRHFLLYLSGDIYPCGAFDSDFETTTPDPFENHRSNRGDDNPNPGDHDDQDLPAQVRAPNAISNHRNGEAQDGPEQRGNGHGEERGRKGQAQAMEDSEQREGSQKLNKR